MDIPDTAQKHTDRENTILKRHSTSYGVAAPYYLINATGGSEHQSTKNIKIINK